MEKKKVTVTVPPEVFRQTKAKAAAEGRTVSDVMEQLMRNYLSAKPPAADNK